MARFKFQNGDQVKDKITGFSGIITGRGDYLTGCNQYAIQPPAKEDGTLPDAHWFDEDRVEKLKKKRKKLTVKKAGGPQHNPAPLK